MEGGTTRQHWWRSWWHLQELALFAEILISASLEGKDWNYCFVWNGRKAGADLVTCCHLSPHPSPLPQGRPRGANFQQGSLCTVRAAISLLCRYQLWCAPAGGASSSGSTDRKEDIWVVTGRMQSGFQGTPCVDDPATLCIPSRGSGNKRPGCVA